MTDDTPDPAPGTTSRALHDAARARRDAARGVLTEPVLGRHAASERDPRSEARHAVVGRGLALGVVGGSVSGALGGATLTIGDGLVGLGLLGGAAFGLVVGLVVGAGWGPFLASSAARRGGRLRSRVVVGAAVTVVVMPAVTIAAAFGTSSLSSAWPGLIVAGVGGAIAVILWLPWCAQPLTELDAPSRPTVPTD